MSELPFSDVIRKAIESLRSAPRYESASDLAWIKAYRVKQLFRIDVTLYPNPNPHETMYALPQADDPVTVIISTVHLIHDGKVDRIDKGVGAWTVNGYRLSENLIRYDLTDASELPF